MEKTPINRGKLAEGRLKLETVARMIEHRDKATAIHIREIIEDHFRFNMPTKKDQDE